MVWFHTTGGHVSFSLFTFISFCVRLLCLVHFKVGSIAFPNRMFYLFFSDLPRVPPAPLSSSVTTDSSFDLRVNVRTTVTNIVVCIVAIGWQPVLEGVETATECDCNDKQQGLQGRFYVCRRRPSMRSFEQMKASIGNDRA